ncbi:Short-chain dehydrogenase TIC 32, chloroplastic [Orchesella cincta]|uniref:Short-chain dehydrogenase TIC 32, chloroplastic n=1 Tax=Orchesella cincta TaxID=48709 RepID=A0A1D2MFS2_ORCCI|nr:Short-chain dehydrogenase TIC 32, chloroplastic [Orchesella cincta]
MGRNNEITPPGSLQERFVSFIWYGVIMAGWLGLISFLDEAFHTVKKFNYEAIPKRKGEVVVLTGGTRGIGFDILKNLLQMDYHVIMGVRKIEAGLAAVETIRKSGVKSGTTQCLPLDLKSLTSVRKFGETILKEKDRVDILLNNAGIMFEPYELTEDGFESHFQVNYLSHFLLTQILLPKLKSTGAKKSTCCRIVNVSSVAHTASAIRNVKELASPKWGFRNMYSGFRAYYDSKLCQVLSTKYLDARLKLEGTNVHVYAVHPGVIPTGLYSSIGIFGQIMHWLAKFYRNSDEGAEIVMYAAISPEIESEGGLYMQNSEKRAPNKIAEDHTIQKTLWELSETCV